MITGLPHLGVGLGHRLPLHRDILRNREHIDFLEIITDQCLYAAPEKTESLFESLKDFPLVPHGVGLSVGTDMPLDEDYLDRTAGLLRRIDAAWFSDHLSFTKVPDVDIGQLTPLWFTEEALEVVCRNVRRVKEKVDAPFLLENITYYFPLPDADMTEAEFITRSLEATDCGLLLDVNNLHINSINLGYDPYDFLMSIPLERVVQVHLGGAHEMLGMIVDTHGASVHREVWEILQFVVANSPVKGIVLERDQDFPDFSEIVETLKTAREILAAPGSTARRSGRSLSCQ